MLLSIFEISLISLQSNLIVGVQYYIYNIHNNIQADLCICQIRRKTHFATSLCKRDMLVLRKEQNHRSKSAAVKGDSTGVWEHREENRHGKNPPFKARQRAMNCYRDLSVLEVAPFPESTLTSTDFTFGW